MQENVRLNNWVGKVVSYNLHIRFYEMIKKKFVVLFAALSRLLPSWLSGCGPRNSLTGGQPMSICIRRRCSLRKAENDKGGHRAATLNLGEQAINEVKQGMECDKK
jgi:hypothetical protein